MLVPPGNRKLDTRFEYALGDQTKAEKNGLFVLIMDNYCTHCFSVELATKVGMREAVILQHLYWWHEHNKAVPSMNIDGRVWFFLSASQIAEVFPYLSEKVVRTIIEKLVADGYLIKDHKGQGQERFNRTNWYALTNCSLGLFHLPKWENGETEMGKSIVNNIVNNNTFTKVKDIDIISGKRFVKPSLDDIRAYCLERKNSVDAETFFDFYESKGWKVGNQPMKDWQAAVRTWEKSRNTRSQAQPQPQQRRNTTEDLLALGEKMFGPQNRNYDEQ